MKRAWLPKEQVLNVYHAYIHTVCSILHVSIYVRYAVHIYDIYVCIRCTSVCTPSVLYVHLVYSVYIYTCLSYTLCTVHYRVIVFCLSAYLRVACPPLV